MKHRKPELGLMGPLMYSVVIVGSALVAVAVGWPIRHGPLGPWLLVVGFVFTAGAIGALPVSDKWLRRRQGSEP
ncbi:hypothetical protein OG401_14385 [Kitasatospora purpeofusca]|uniref:hypothetical protein n=1 Tax=Kitasatospora purpeofusca TaxID=67352 RepID=UPI0022512A82|nr:hypothetical protein [Kitasatospora purpeofusca]MCX4685487.1 hypothetical protein [Kitasatospora purpeofusca]